MRKNKLKNYLKLGILLFGVSLLLVNCEKDIVDLTENESIIKEKNFKILKITTDEISQNATLVNRLLNLENSIKNFDSQNRTDDSEGNSFTVDTDFATYIETTDGNYHTYTFPVLREVDNGLFENLLVSLNQDEEYDAYLIQYDLTDSELSDLLFGNQIDLTDKVTKTIVDDDNLLSSLFSRTIDDCVTVVTEFCGHGNHPGGRINGAPCPQFESVTEQFCSFGGGGGGVGTSDPISGGDAGEGGSTGTNSNSGVNQVDPYYTAPTCADCPEFDEGDPCIGLKNNSRSPDFIAKMNDLDTKSTTLEKEAGYVEKPNSTGTGSDYDYVEGNANTGFIEWDIPDTTTLKGIYHTHYDTENHLPVFSGDDLYALFSLFGPVFDVSGNVTFENPHNIGNSFTYILITAHGTKLALKFNDATSIEKFRLFGEKYFGDWDIAVPPTILGVTPEETDRQKFKKVYDKFVQEKFSLEKQKKKFARFLDKNDLGVSLYQANNDFSEWEKINKSGAATPCH